jgi:cation:H+ antiporter
MVGMLPYLLLIAGFILLIKGADFLVNGASSMARRFKVSDLVIGLTIVAFGTSTPELATSAMAAYRRNVEIAVGNVVGSNIFNVLFVLAVSSIIKPLPFKETNNIDIGMVNLAELLLFAFMFTERKRLLDRWEGIVFLSLYAAYFIFLIVQ